MKKTASISDKAKKIARQVIIQEPTEVLKTAKTQILGEAPQSVSYDLSQQQTPSNPNINREEEQKIKKWEVERLGDLEKELQEEKAKRQKQLESWREQQEALMKAPEEEQQGLVEPKTKPKRGMGAVKKKQGTKEIGRTVSG